MKEMDHVSLKLIRLAFSFSLNRNKWTRKTSRDLFSRWTLQKQKKNYSASESMNVQYRDWCDIVLLLLCSPCLLAREIREKKRFHLFPIGLAWRLLARLTTDRPTIVHHQHVYLYLSIYLYIYLSRKTQLKIEWIYQFERLRSINIHRHRRRCRCRRRRRRYRKGVEKRTPNKPSLLCLDRCYPIERLVILGRRRQFVSFFFPFFYFCVPSPPSLDIK